jgi:hypothetical protein
MLEVRQRRHIAGDIDALSFDADPIAFAIGVFAAALAQIALLARKVRPRVDRLSIARAA